MQDNRKEQVSLPPTRDYGATDSWIRKWGAYPVAREDVERLIELNGGTPEDLHLQDRDLEGINLIGLTSRAHY